MWHGGPVRPIGLSYRAVRMGIDSWALKMFTKTGSVGIVNKEINKAFLTFFKNYIFI
jgi:hypothetical protein